MWKRSQSRMRPHGLRMARLRSEYRVSVANMSRKPSTPRLCPRNPLAAGTPAREVTPAYRPVISATASPASQSSRDPCTGAPLLPEREDRAPQRGRFIQQALAHRADVRLAADQVLEGAGEALIAHHHRPDDGLRPQQQAGAAGGLPGLPPPRRR